MNDYRKQTNYHNTRPIVGYDKFLENADLLLEYYNKFKKEYIKLSKKKKGLVSNHMIDDIFNKVIDEKEIPIEVAHLIDAFFDMVINTMMMLRDSKKTDCYVATVLDKSIHQIIQK